MLVNEDIDEIIRHGEERTAEINQKYAALNIDDLNNFKSDFSVKEWEGEEFDGKVQLCYLIRAQVDLLMSSEQIVRIWVAATFQT